MYSEQEIVGWAGSGNRWQGGTIALGMRCHLADASVCGHGLYPPAVKEGAGRNLLQPRIAIVLLPTCLALSLTSQHI